MKTTTFATLLREYEKQATNPDSETAYATALSDLATAVAFSVLKKCIDVAHNETLVKVRQSLARDLHTLDTIAHASETAYATRYTADGDTTTVIADKDAYSVLTALCAESLGDGIDLQHTAVLAILEETRKATERGQQPPEFMEKPYSVRRLKRKVWINTADSVKGWETVETTPIQEVYKAVRREIENNKALHTDPKSGYTYLEELATDSETDTDSVIYRRFGKYADIGGAVTDFNGKETAYTADRATAETMDTLLEALNLTARQAEILQLRLRGYGYKAIATYIGIRPDSVRDCMKAIQRKATAIGLTAEK